MLRLNVGGTVFTTSKSTLIGTGENYFTALLNGRRLFRLFITIQYLLVLYLLLMVTNFAMTNRLFARKIPREPLVSFVQCLLTSII